MLVFDKIKMYKIYRIGTEQNLNVKSEIISSMRLSIKDWNA